MSAMQEWEKLNNRLDTTYYIGEKAVKEITSALKATDAPKAETKKKKSDS